MSWSTYNNCSENSTNILYIMIISGAIYQRFSIAYFVRDYIGNIVTGTTLWISQLLNYKIMNLQWNSNGNIVIGTLEKYLSNKI